MTTHSSVLAWRIRQTEKPGGLQFMGHKGSHVTEQLSTAQVYKTDKTAKINNKDLICCLGNYIQYLVMEKNLKKNSRCMYTCTTESLCCASDTNTAL